MYEMDNHKLRDASFNSQPVRGGCFTSSALLTYVAMLFLIAALSLAACNPGGTQPVPNPTDKAETPGSTPSPNVNDQQDAPTPIPVPSPTLGLSSSGSTLQPTHAAPSGTKAVRPTPAAVPSASPTPSDSPQATRAVSESATPPQEPSPVPPVIRLTQEEIQSGIESLGWVHDGKAHVGDEHTFDYEDRVHWGMDTIELLEELGSKHSEIFQAVIESHWLQNAPQGITWERWVGLGNIIQIADVDRASALQILQLPFLNSMEFHDGETATFLRDLFRDDLETGRELISNPDLQYPETGSTPADFYLQYLRMQDPQVVSAVESLKWIQDGVEPFKDGSIPSLITNAEYESLMLRDLIRLHLEVPEAFLSMAQRSWVQEQVAARKYTAFTRFLDLAKLAPEVAPQIATMPFLDDFDASDITILRSMESFAMDRPWEMETVLLAPEFAEGILDHHSGTVALLLLTNEDPELGAILRGIPWVGDGIAETEDDWVQTLVVAPAGATRFFRMMVTRPWVLDGLQPDELSVLNSLGMWMVEGRGEPEDVRRGEQLALRILEMPFLEKVDSIDAAAVSALRELERRNYLEEILSHPSLAGGITDETAPLVAALSIPVRQRPDLMSVLLDGGPGIVEKRVLDLPHSGEVTISVINLDGGHLRTLDILEDSIRRQEAFMGLPFPTTYAGLLVADATARGGGGGPGGILTVSSSRAENRYIIAHELAHSYWPFFPSWIAEGGAEFLSWISGIEDFPVGCDLVENLSQWDLLYVQSFADPDIEDAMYVSNCEYELGRGLLFDLHHALGELQFREGFQRLYLSLRDDKLREQCSGVEVGLCYLNDSFVASDPVGAATIAKQILAHWYYGSP